MFYYYSSYKPLVTYMYQDITISYRQKNTNTVLRAVKKNSYKKYLKTLHTLQKRWTKIH